MREAGYYWVKQTHNSKWEVANWRIGSTFRSIADGWFVPGWEGLITDNEMFKIDEHKLIDPDYLKLLI